MATFSLSDLVMLQMVGGLDKFTTAVIENSDPYTVIEETRRKATTPHLFPEIVRKTIETQFSDPLTAVRELGQNARDAYSLEQIPKKIEFSTRTEEEDQVVLSCRDYGVGMQPRDVLKNLLIPYNSGKEMDLTKIGEHGIGWFSIMDISSKVEVRTRNGIGLLTYAEIKRDTGEWAVSLDVKDEAFLGTEIVMYLEKKLDEAKIKDGLKRHLGFAHPEEIDVTLNGEKVNTLVTNYILAGESAVENKDLEGRLRLHMCKERQWDNPDLLTVTQNGLYVKDLGNPFDPKSVHHDLFDKLRRYGVSFWIDLPSNIGLTKGRNNVIADDLPKITEALYPAFEQAILDVIMEDEKMVQSLDNVIAEIVGKIFEKTYATTKKSVRERLTAKLKEIKEQAILKLGPAVRGELSGHVDGSQYALAVRTGRTVDDKIEITVVTRTAENDYFMQVSSKPKTKEEEQAENKRKQYLAEVTGLSKEMITKRFIPSCMVDSQGVRHSEKISIEDMIVAYEIGSLYDGEATIASSQGVYVNRSNAVVNKIYEVLHREVAEIRKLQAATEGQQRAKELVARIESTSAHRPRTAIEPRATTFVIEEPKDQFERTGIHTFEKIVKSEGVGGEYLTFFYLMTYLDQQISQPNKMQRSYLAIHDKKEHYGKQDIAHTNHEGISFNLNTSVIQHYVGAIRRGQVKPTELISMLELVLHEKAHCQESYSSHLSHGNDFFVVRKKGLRDTTLAYFHEKAIDPLAQVNENLQQAPTIEKPLYRGERLAELVRKYKE